LSDWNSLDLETSFLLVPKSAQTGYPFLFELTKGILFVVITSLLLWRLCTSFLNQIEQGQKRYKNYVAQSPIAIGVYNSEGTALDLNQAATTLTGYSREDTTPPKQFVAQAQKTTKRPSSL